MNDDYCYIWIVVGVFLAAVGLMFSADENVAGVVLCGTGGMLMGMSILEYWRNRNDENKPGGTD